MNQGSLTRPAIGVASSGEEQRLLAKADMRSSHEQDGEKLQRALETQIHVCNPEFHRKLVHAGIAGWLMYNPGITYSSAA